MRDGRFLGDRLTVGLSQSAIGLTIWRTVIPDRLSFTYLSIYNEYD